MSDPHHFLAALKNALGDDVDRTVVANFIGNYTPVGRAELLRSTEALISDESSPANLRQRSQLLRFTRELRHLDTALRRSGK